MNNITREIEKGVKIHYLKNDIFKTNIISIFISTPLERETVTLNALLPAVLRRGTKECKTQEEINIMLEEMYGTEYDGGVEKIADNQVLKFYIETINDKFLSESILEKSIELLLDIVFNPLLEDNSFKPEYVNSEKENLNQIINSKIDNKDTYSLDECIGNMYKGENYALYKYGYVEDLQKINSQELYERYKALISNSKIDIYVSGDIDKNKLDEIFDKNENIKKINDREPIYIVNNTIDNKKDIDKANVVEEKMNIAQGKLVIGLDIKENSENTRYTAAMYNTILGESANSKLFQNVREKAQLAYSARSSYIRQKSNIFVRCGIDIENYEKAVDIIKEQLRDMQEGKFTQEDLANAKKYMESAIKLIKTEQDAQIIYYIGQELSNSCIDLDEFIENIKRVTQEQIRELANKIDINTIYFLRN